MAQAVEQAQKQRELSKEALAADLERLEARVRSELDVKARLRRDGVRIAAIGGAAVLLVGAIVLIRLRLGKRDQEVDEATASLEDLRAELRSLRKAVDKQKGGSLVQKAVLRGVSAVAGAAGTYAARQVLTRQGSRREGENGKPGAG